MTKLLDFGDFIFKLSYTVTEQLVPLFQLTEMKIVDKKDWFVELEVDGDKNEKISNLIVDFFSRNKFSNEIVTNSAYFSTLQGAEEFMPKLWANKVFQIENNIQSVKEYLLKMENNAQLMLDELIHEKKRVDLNNLSLFLENHIKEDKITCFDETLSGVTGVLEFSFSVNPSRVQTFASVKCIDFLESRSEVQETAADRVFSLEPMVYSLDIYKTSSSYSTFMKMNDSLEFYQEDGFAYFYSVMIPTRLVVESNIESFVKPVRMKLLNQTNLLIGKLMEVQKGLNKPFSYSNVEMSFIL